MSGGRQSGANGGVAGIGRRSAHAHCPKQITVISSEGAVANSFCKAWRCWGNGWEAGEVTVCPCIPHSFTRSSGRDYCVYVYEALHSLLHTHNNLMTVSSLLRFPLGAYGVIEDVAKMRQRRKPKMMKATQECANTWQSDYNSACNGSILLSPHTSSQSCLIGNAPNHYWPGRLECWPEIRKPCL